jgi:hypothetical protein
MPGTLKQEACRRSSKIHPQITILDKFDRHDLLHAAPTPHSSPPCI